MIVKRHELVALVVAARLTAGGHARPAMRASKTFGRSSLFAGDERVLRFDLATDGRE
jgi:hypothetical protein